MKSIFNLTFKFFASFGLAVAIFVFMFLLILFGTLYQVDHGLYEAQNKYFSSMFVVHKLGPVAIPLPGGYLLMSVLGVNLVCGGLIRMRNRMRRPGILITHIGVLVLLISAGVTYHFSDRGHMRLYPGEMSDVFQSYYDWDIEVGKPAAGATLQLIPDKLLKDLGPGDSRTFYADALPIEVTVTNYMPNAMPVQVASAAGSDARIVDGFRLESLPPEKEAEMNVPGAYVSVTDTASGETTQGILWGLALEPLTVRSGDVYYTVGLARKSYKAPFVVRVDDFRREIHAGTNMDASFESDVTKIEDGAEEKILIWLNHPLRRKGFTFFQASWGPTNAGPNDRLFTVFEVVRNPADQGPLVACIIIGIGMLIQFLQKLSSYMRAETRMRAA